MRSVRRITGLLVLIAFALVPAYAQRPEKRASTRGAIVPSGDCLPAATEPCMSVTPLTSNTAAFVNFGNGPENASWTLFEVPTTQSVTFQLTPTSLGVGSFICGDGFTPADFGGYCTGLVDPDGTTATDFVQSVLDAADHQVKFSFLNVSDLPTEWVFYADPGDAAIIGSSTVPEPGTFTLLVCALLGLIVINSKRLRWQN